MSSWDVKMTNYPLQAIYLRAAAEQNVPTSFSALCEFNFAYVHGVLFIFNIRFPFYLLLQQKQN